MRVLGRGGFGALGTDEHLPRCSDMDSDLGVYPYVIFLRPELAVQLDASIEWGCFFCLHWALDRVDVTATPQRSV